MSHQGHFFLEYMPTVFTSPKSPVISELRKYMFLLIHMYSTLCTQWPIQCGVISSIWHQWILLSRLVIINRRLLRHIWWIRNVCFPVFIFIRRLDYSIGGSTYICAWSCKFMFIIILWLFIFLITCLC